jgi:hypothetical protein
MAIVKWFFGGPLGPVTWILILMTVTTFFPLPHQIEAVEKAKQEQQ